MELGLKDLELALDDLGLALEGLELVLKDLVLVLESPWRMTVPILRYVEERRGENF